MAVLIGHASINEKGTSRNGTAGDQTRKEVFTRDWYIVSSNPWTVVIRPNDSVKAEKIAIAMEQACANDNIGYDQNQRTTLYTQAKALNWDISKITTPCECDCSSLVAVCVNAAGITVSKDIYTGNQVSALEKTGAFTVLTDPKYVGKSDYLKRGDILFRPGHTVIVLSDGELAIAPATEVEEKPKKTEKKATDSAKNFLSTLKGTYKVTASRLNVRNGAGTLKKSMVIIPKDTKVKCYGYYTKALTTNWLYVQFTYKDVLYTGFASAKYLAKQ